MAPLVAAAPEWPGIVRAPPNLMDSARAQNKSRSLPYIRPQGSFPAESDEPGRGMDQIPAQEVRPRHPNEMRAFVVAQRQGEARKVALHRMAKQLVGAKKDQYGRPPSRHLPQQAPVSRQFVTTRVDYFVSLIAKGRPISRPTRVSSRLKVVTASMFDLGDCPANVEIGGAALLALSR
jgi:hypothetical protein